MSKDQDELQVGPCKCGKTSYACRAYRKDFEALMLPLKLVEMLQGQAIKLRAVHVQLD